MQNKSVNPEKITKPIQVLAAWLLGLLSINGSFLATATIFPSDSWQSGFLVVTAFLNVPIFLGAVFLLQTKFRPELQEDAYYSSYLNRKSNEHVIVDKFEALNIELSSKVHALEQKFQSNEQQIESEFILKNVGIGLNKYIAIPELNSVKNKYHIDHFSMFGSDKPPTNKVMAISRHLSSEQRDEAIQLAKDLKLDGYSFFDNWAEETKEDILIGAYGPVNYLFQ
ncbi:hypothetical protein [Photobacterium leiognathi]|uniref:hypothetical protein n=1 Tax=Photobacterium leiognathi TaxID=553611 RepID=UPI0029816F06|nr:hypothetical protein [Photobacterium leiognathi]